LKGVAIVRFFIVLSSVFATWFLMVAPALAQSPKDLSYVCKLPAIKGTVYFVNTIEKRYVYNDNASLSGQAVKLHGTPGNGSVMFSKVPVQGKSVRVTILSNGAATTSLDVVDDPSVTGVYGNSAKKMAHPWGSCKLTSLDDPQPAVAVKKKSKSPHGETMTNNVEPMKVKKGRIGSAPGCLVPHENDGGLYEWRNVCSYRVVAFAINYFRGVPLSDDFREVDPGRLFISNARKPYPAEAIWCKAPYEPAQPIDERYFNKPTDQLPDCVLP
jgi:hypothetical protein